MSDNDTRHWSVTRTVELNATAKAVWDVISEFYLNGFKALQEMFPARGRE